ncbi:MAG: hypothetical protein ENTB_03777 [Enterocloster aldenensis]
MERKQEDKPPEEPEELLREFEWAKDHIPDSEVPQPAPDDATGPANFVLHFVLHSTVRSGFSMDYLTHSNHQ